MKKLLSGSWYDHIILSAFFQTFSHVMSEQSLFHICYILCFFPFSSQYILTRVEGDISLGVSLGQCIVTVGGRFFDVNKDIVIIRHKEMAYEIPKYRMGLKKNKDWIFYSAERHFLQNIFHCYDKNYLLEVSNFEDASHAFRIIKELNCWNPNQRIFIFSSVIFKNQTSQFFQLISLTYQQMLNNVVIMLPTEDKHLSFDLFYWKSKDNERCKKKAHFPHFFSCSFGNVSVLQDNQRNSSRCSLAVKAIVYPPFITYNGETNKDSGMLPVDKNLLGGLEIELTNLISELLDIDVKYYISTKEDWGRSFFNGSTTQAMYELTSNKVDLVIGSLTLTLSRYLLFGTTIPYSEEYMVFCVPSHAHLDVWSTAMNKSSINVYISIWLMYALLTTAIWRTAKFSKEEFQRFRRAPVFLYTFSAIIGNAINVLPKTRRVRMFFMMLLIFEIFYLAFYQSMTTSVLSTQQFDQDIKTIRDVLGTNMKIYSQEEDHRYFEQSKHYIAQKILQNSIDCEETKQCLENVQKSSNLAILVGEKTKDYILQNNKKAGTPTLYCLNHKIITYPVVMLMRKSLPFREKIDEIIGRSISSGLVNKWTSSMFFNRTSDSSTTPKALSGILKFDHLKPVFCSASVGLGFSSLVFLVERMFYSIFKKCMTRISRNARKLYQ